MSRDALSPLAGFSPIVSLHANRQQRQGRLPSPIIVPGYPIDEHPTRTRSAQARASRGQHVRSPAPPSVPIQAARPPPLPTPSPSTRSPPAPVPFSAVVNQPPPTSCLLPYYAAPQAIPVPLQQAHTSPYAQWGYMVSTHNRGLAGPALPVQPQTAFPVVPQVPQMPAVVPVLPPRPQSAPPHQPTLVFVNPYRVNDENIVWIGGQPYNKEAYVRSLSPRARIDLARQIVHDNPNRTSCYLKTYMLRAFGVHACEHPDVARILESADVPPWAPVVPEDEPSSSDEEPVRHKKSRNLFKCRGRKSCTYDDGWPGTSGSAGGSMSPGQVYAHGSSVLMGPNQASIFMPRTNAPTGPSITCMRESISSAYTAEPIPQEVAQTIASLSPHSGPVIINGKTYGPTAIYSKADGGRMVRWQRVA